MQQKRAKGESILRAHQYAKALGLTDKGDNTLLIWLGKQRLEQRENIEKKQTEAEKEKLDKAAALLDYLQSKSDLNIADSNIINADKSRLEAGEIRP